MKRKGMQVLGLGLSVLCAACGLREASESQATSAPTAPPVSAVVSNPVTSPPEKEALVLFPDLANARPDRGEVILSLPAGEGDHALFFLQNPDMPVYYETPEANSFAVSDAGEVYIGGKSGVRVFRDNRFVSVMQFPLENADVTNVPLLPVGDMTVIGETLYVADMYTNRVSAVIDGKAVPLDLGDWGR